ncbi:P-selectin-like [Ruditapes philippinarum]|uniref:P-selectin-like n=1 Tax=Ruditapes philippinarum TaxID=129788 RepID=UPI00295BE9EE|nr:P-selectin-like [Ruditapes philippinarum]
MEMHVCVLIVFLLGFGVDFTTQIKKIEPELSEKKCYIKEIESFYRNGCFGVEEDGHMVRHQGWCIVGDDQRLTCVHGHWSGTDSSVELLQRNKRFWSVIGGAIVTCIIFCGKRSGGRTPIKYRPSFPRPCTPKDIKGNYNVGAGENSVVVRWTVPSATDRNGGTPRVIQVDGGINGGRFHGTTYGKVHHIKYKATDSDGMSTYCDFSFSVTVLTCNLLPWPANGARKCDNSNILGSTCHYTCNNGYKLTGTSKVTCENAVSPSWSAIPTCDKMTCSEPKYPSHSTVMCSDSNYGYQSICIFKCDSGYALKGARHIQCQADGKWSNYEASSCIDDTPPTISCVTPQIFYADRGVTMGQWDQF